MKLKVTLIKSVIGSNQKLRDNVKTLGLTKLNSSVVLEDTPSNRGKISKVAHLLRVEESK